MGAAAVSLASRIVLALVLAFAAAAKLRAAENTRAQTIALVGARRGPLVARALPFVEIAVAVALVAWWSPVPRPGCRPPGEGVTPSASLRPWTAASRSGAA